MEKLRKYLNILDKIDDLFDELPTMGYDYDDEIADNKEKITDLLIEQRILIEKKLKQKEMGRMK